MKSPAGLELPNSNPSVELAQCKHFTYWMFRLRSHWKWSCHKNSVFHSAVETLLEAELLQSRRSCQSRLENTQIFPNVINHSRFVNYVPPPPPRSPSPGSRCTIADSWNCRSCFRPHNEQKKIGTFIFSKFHTSTRRSPPPPGRLPWKKGSKRQRVLLGYIKDIVGFFRGSGEHIKHGDHSGRNSCRCL